MRSFTALSSFLSLASAAYVIQDDYTPSNFANMFDFFTGADPTQGFVNYISQSQAQSSGLYKVTNNQVYMGVDSTNTSPSGRNSIRITSKQTYNHGLIILDLAHMPGGQCGTWPAFWMLGPDWPNQGEIDIIEGVNSQTTNAFTLHTNQGCSITSSGNFAGQTHTSNCWNAAPGQPSNAGCLIGSTTSQSYGAGFNAVGGGVFATEWTSDAISMWFFPRAVVPADITSGSSPDPEAWGLPAAQFTGDCDIDSHIRDQQLVFDMTFCGQWAGQVWGSDAVCGSKAATCQDFVADNPGAFVDAYWSVNGLKVYQDNGNGAAVASVVPAPAGTSVDSTATLSPTTSVTQTNTSDGSPNTPPPAPAPTTTTTPPSPPPSNTPASKDKVSQDKHHHHHEHNRRSKHRHDTLRARRSRI